MSQKAKDLKTQKELTQINLQQLASENPGITKAFSTIAMVLIGLKTDELETDLNFHGDHYHFEIKRTKKASGIVDGDGKVIA